MAESSPLDLKVTRYERSDGVALITLDRPDRLNAWTARMELELREGLTRARRDSQVRAVVITGAGRGFCAGADMDALDGLAQGQPYQTAPPMEGELDSGSVLTLATRIPKPVIAAVNGPAAGVGFVLMCFADMRFAAAGAKLTTSFSRLGLPAEHGVAWALGRLIGPSKSADLLFSSRVVLAEEALTMGLVDRVFPVETVLDQALAYARSLATDVSPASLAAIKGQLWSGLDGSLAQSSTRAADLLAAMLGAADFAEGVAAFRAQRPPVFGPSPDAFPA